MWFVGRKCKKLVFLKLAASNAPRTAVPSPQKMESEATPSPGITLVVDEVLCFINNKLSLMGVTSIITLCENFYDDITVERAKMTLQKYCKNDSLEWKRRKGTTDKTTNNLKDIIKGIQCGDIGDVEFVAKDLSKLPPISFNDLDAGAILQKMTKMGEEIKTLNKAVSKQGEITSSLIQLQQEKVPDITHGNGSETDVGRSTPLYSEKLKSQASAKHPLQSPKNDNSHELVQPTSAIINRRRESSIPYRNNGPEVMWPPTNPVISSFNEKTTDSEASKLSTPPLLNPLARSFTPEEMNNFISHVRNFGPSMVNANAISEQRDENPNPWMQVSSKKRRGKTEMQVTPIGKPVSSGRRQKTIVGTSRSAGLKTVQNQLNFFTTRWDPRITQPEIEKLLSQKLKVKVKCEKLQLKSKSYASFKVTVWSNDEKYFQNPDAWPEGLVVSKYFEGSKRPDREMQVFKSKKD